MKEKNVILKKGEKMTMAHLKRHIPEVAVNVLLEDYEIALKSEMITKKEVTRLLNNMYSKILRECLTKSDAVVLVKKAISAYMKSPEFAAAVKKVVGDVATKQFVLDELKDYQTKLTSSTKLGTINGVDLHFGESIKIGDFVVNGQNDGPVEITTTKLTHNGKEVVTDGNIESKVETLVTGSTSVKATIAEAVSAEVSKEDSDLRKNVELLIQNQVSDESTPTHNTIKEIAEGVVDAAFKDAWINHEAE